MPRTARLDPRPTSVPTDATDPVSSPPARSEPGAKVRVADEPIHTGALSVVGGGIREATADRVEVRQGGIGRLRADDVSVTQGGIGIARADRVDVELGGVGVALAADARVTQGAVGTIVAREATLDRAVVRTILAGEVRFERPAGVFLVIAGRVVGDVRPLLDWRGALAFGAAVGLVSRLAARRLGR